MVSACFLHHLFSCSLAVSCLPALHINRDAAQFTALLCMYRSLLGSAPTSLTSLRPCCPRGVFPELCHGALASCSSLTGCRSPPFLVNSDCSAGLFLLPHFLFCEGLRVPLHSCALIHICGYASWVCSHQSPAPCCGTVKDVTSFPSLYL